MTNEESLYDDRLLEHPYNDCELEKIITEYKAMYDKRWKIPYKDTTSFSVTLNFYTENDTDKVWIVGIYGVPIVFHDSLLVEQKVFDQDDFLGYFKRNNGYCFVYKQLWKSLSGYTYSDRLKGVVKNYLQDWRLRNQADDPEFFYYDSSEGCIDSYVIEYAVDSLEKFHYLKEGFR